MAFWKKKEESDSEANELKRSGSAQPKSSDVEQAMAQKPSPNEPSVLGGAGAGSRPSAPQAGSAVTSSVPSHTSSVTKQSSADPIEDRFGVVRSALGPGTVIQGKLSFDTPVRIDGKLTGDIFSSQALIVGDAGEIDATVEVATLIVMGKVSGKIKATERIELWAGGKLEGEISTPIFMMEDTAVFNGSCSMGAKSDKLTKSAADSSDKKKKSATESKSNEAESHKEVRVH